MQYKYHISPVAVSKIRSFYRNMMLKYPNTYSYYDMLRYINKTVDSIYTIEQVAARRKPTISRWEKWHMAHTGHWYYAYSINDDVITIHDTCHELNMYD